MSDTSGEAFGGEEELLGEQSPVPYEPPAPDEAKEEEDLESVLTEYDADDFISGAVVSQESTIPEDLFYFEHSYGYNCQKYFNVCSCDETVVAWAAGSLLTFLDVGTGQTWFRRSTTGGTVCHIASHRKDPNYRIAVAEAAEGGRPPIILIYFWPQMDIDAVLRDGTTKAYSILDFSPDGELLASVGREPDYNITIWQWKRHSILLRTSAFTFDVNAVIFSPYVPGQLTTAGAAHIKFWKMANTFTGLKLKGDLGRFGKTEICDILGVYPMPDEKVLSGCEWGNILVWEAGLVKVEVTQRGRKRCHDAPIVQFMLSDARDEVMTVARDGCVRAWYWDTVEQADPPEDDQYVELNPVAETCAPGAAIMCIRHQKDQHWYAQDGNGGVWTVDLELDKLECSHRKVFTCHAGAVTALVALRAQPLFVSLGEDGALHVYHVEQRTLLLQQRYPVPVRSLLYPPLEVDPTSLILVIGFEDGVLRTVMVEAEALLQKPPGLVEVVVDPTLESDVHIEDINNPAYVKLISLLKPHSAAVTQISLNLQNTLLVTASEDLMLFMYRVSLKEQPFELQRLGFIDIPSIIGYMAWKPDEERTLLLCAQEGLLLEVVLPNAEVRPYNEITSFQLEFKSRKESFMKEYLIQHRPFPVEDDLASLDEEALKKAAEDSSDDEDEDEWRGEVELVMAEAGGGARITWAKYAQDGSVWCVQKGLGALLQYRPGAKDVHKYGPLPGAWEDSITTLQFICDERYILVGTGNGYIRVVRVLTPEEDNPDVYVVRQMLASQRLAKKLKGRRLAKPEPDPIPRLDFTDNYYLPMHDLYTGAITSLEITSDGKRLLSSGADGNIFSYLINFPEPLKPPFFQEFPVTLEVPGVREPSTADGELMSHEQLKQKEEHDKMMAIANAHKKRVRDQLAALTGHYIKLVRANRQLPVPQQIDVTLDLLPPLELEREVDEARALVRRKLAHQLEASDLRLSDATCDDRNRQLPVSQQIDVTLDPRPPLELEREVDEARALVRRKLAHQLEASDLRLSDATCDDRNRQLPVPQQIDVTLDPRPPLELEREVDEARALVRRKLAHQLEASDLRLSDATCDDRNRQLPVPQQIDVTLDPRPPLELEREVDEARALVRRKLAYQLEASDLRLSDATCDDRNRQLPVSQQIDVTLDPRPPLELEREVDEARALVRRKLAHQLEASDLRLSDATCDDRNRQLPVSQQIDVTLDPRPPLELEREVDEARALVRRKLAYQLEASDLRLSDATCDDRNRQLPVSQQIDVTLDPRPPLELEREVDEARALVRRKLAHQLEASDLRLSDATCDDRNRQLPVSQQIDVTLDPRPPLELEREVDEARALVRRKLAHQLEASYLRLSDATCDDRNRQLPVPQQIDVTLDPRPPLELEREVDEARALVRRKLAYQLEASDLRLSDATCDDRNRQLPVSQQIDVTLDPRPPLELEREVDEARALVRRKLAHQLEASDLRLAKMHGRNIICLDVFPFTLKAIRDPDDVIKPLRQKNLSSDFYDQLDEVHTKMAEAALRMKDVDLLEKPKRTASVVRHTAAKKVAWGAPRTASFLLGLPPMPPHPLKKALRNYYQRLTRHHEQHIEWQEHLSRKPDPSALPPGAEEALQEAEASIGNYLLKTEPNYVAPPGHNTQLRLCLTRQEIYENKHEFNTKVVALREEKLRLVRAMREVGERLAEIRAEVPPALAKSPPLVPDLDLDLEFPENNLKVCVEVPPAVRRPASKLDRHKSQSVFPQMRVRAPRVSAFVDLLEKRPLLATWELLKGKDADLTPFEKEIKQRRIQRRLYEQDMLLADAEVSIGEFDARLKELQRERIRVQERNQLLELHLQQLHREMIVLNRFESHEDSLAERVYSKLMQVRGVHEQIDACKRRVEEHLAERERLEAGVQDMQRVFKRLVQDNKFADFLRRIFKKKYRPPRDKDADESSESESESTSSSEEDEGSIDSRDIGPIRLDPNVCPEGCEREIYEQTFELRNTRHKFEQDMREQDRLVELLHKDIDAHNRVHRTLSLQLEKRQNNLREFMTEKQSCMNEVEVTVVLRYDQIRANALAGCEGPEGLDNTLVFPETLLSRLRRRVLELQQEISDQKIRHKTNRTHLHRMEVDVRHMEGRVEELRARMRDVLARKLGRVRRVDRTLDELLKQMARRFKFRAGDAPHAALYGQIRHWRERYGELEQKYLTTLEMYSDRLRLAAALQADQYPVKEQRDVSQCFGSYRPDEYERDVVRMRIVRAQQRDQIKALRDEIHRLKMKPLAPLPPPLPSEWPQSQRESEFSLFEFPPTKSRKRTKYFPIESAETKPPLETADGNEVISLLWRCAEALGVPQEDSMGLLSELTNLLPLIVAGSTSRYRAVDGVLRSRLQRAGDADDAYRDDTRAFDALNSLLDTLLEQNLSYEEGSVSRGDAVQQAGLASLEAALQLLPSRSSIEQRLGAALEALLQSIPVDDFENTEVVATIVTSLLQGAVEAPTAEQLSKIDINTIVDGIEGEGKESVWLAARSVVEALAEQAVEGGEERQLEREVSHQLSRPPSAASPAPRTPSAATLPGADTPPTPSVASLASETAPQDQSDGDSD